MLSCPLPILRSRIDLRLSCMASWSCCLEAAAEKAWASGTASSAVAMRRAPQRHHGDCFRRNCRARGFLSQAAKESSFCSSFETAFRFRRRQPCDRSQGCWPSAAAEPDHALGVRSNCEERSRNDLPSAFARYTRVGGLVSWGRRGVRWEKAAVRSLMTSTPQRHPLPT